MAGIYLHIPFCKQACHYCNFHFSTSLKYKDEMVLAMLRELELQKDYLGGEPVETIYFGGGTPSLLGQGELGLFFDKINSLFNFRSSIHDCEITLEANPDDLTTEKIKVLADTPVNRLSIGVQSFFENDLQYMNRAHNATEAEACIKNAQDQGFENLTIDLIYGSPSSSDSDWEKNIDKAVGFQIRHLSCYGLTVEPHTALHHFVKTGKSKPVDEEQAVRQFDILMDRLGRAEFEHYEISNFAKEGFYSKHNTAYWQGKKYLGIGPSAHSFNGISRQWNVANNAKYLRASAENQLDFEVEVLTPEQRYNEYILTGLRTMWGVGFDKIKEMRFGEHFVKKTEPFLRQELIVEDGRHFKLSQKGKVLADGIASALFV